MLLLHTSVCGRCVIRARPDQSLVTCFPELTPPILIYGAFFDMKR